MNKIRLPRLLCFGLLFILTACQAAKQPLDTKMFKPGDTIDGMSLTTGAADTPPLWAFCSPAQEDQHVMKTDCRIPPMISEVAIGQAFNIVTEIPTTLDWSQFTWKLSVDEQPIDLANFGIYHFAMPTTSSTPFPVREVFKTFTAWDIVLTNLKPGAHTLNGVAQSETEIYTWIVNLIIEAPYASDFGAKP
jgi:hypothetical protein